MLEHIVYTSHDQARLALILTSNSLAVKVGHRPRSKPFAHLTGRSGAFIPDYGLRNQEYRNVVSVSQYYQRSQGITQVSASRRIRGQGTRQELGRVRADLAARQGRPGRILGRTGGTIALVPALEAGL